MPKPNHLLFMSCGKRVRLFLAFVLIKISRSSFCVLLLFDSTRKRVKSVNILSSLLRRVVPTMGLPLFGVSYVRKTALPFCNHEERGKRAFTQSVTLSLDQCVNFSTFYFVWIDFIQEFFLLTLKRFTECLRGGST